MRRDDALVDEAEIDRLVRERELAAGYREAAHRALAFAHRYRDEEGAAGGSRERACIVQAQEWRRAIHDLHAGRPVPAVPESVRPGLVRARPAAGDDSGRKTG